MKELALYILDIFYNSAAADAALIRIAVKEDSNRNLFSVKVTDNGCGIDRTLLKKVKDPFVTTRTTRKVGMGIPLLTQAAEQSGGNLVILSKKDFGTTLTANFELDHVDRPPLGDMVSSLLAMILSLDEKNLIYTHSIDGIKITFDTREIREIIGSAVSLSSPEEFKWIKEYLTELYNEFYLETSQSRERG